MANSRVRRIGAAAAVAFGLGSSAFAQQPRRVELVEAGGRTLGTIHVSNQAVTLESGDGQSVIYTSTSLIHLNHKDKTYYEQTSEDLSAMAAKAVKELPAGKEPPPGVEYTLTSETETIAGCKARKLVRTNRGTSDAAWVCKEWPAAEAMRKAGERLGSIFPPTTGAGSAARLRLIGTVSSTHSAPRRRERQARVCARVTDGQRRPARSRFRRVRRVLARSDAQDYRSNGGVLETRHGPLRSTRTRQRLWEGASSGVHAASPRPVLADLRDAHQVDVDAIAPVAVVVLVSADRFSRHLSAQPGLFVGLTNRGIARPLAVVNGPLRHNPAFAPRGRDEGHSNAFLADPIRNDRCLTTRLGHRFLRLT